MHLQKSALALTIILFIYYPANSQDNEKSFSTSISGMVHLLETEKQLIESVDKYAEELQKKVDALKNLVHELKEENQKSANNPEEYLFNPLNGFALIRRMHYDWPHIELFMIKPVGENYLETIQNYRPAMPTATDLSEASEALYRLQLVYDLKPLDMSNGSLNGKQYDVKLKPIDSYFMGYHLYSQELYYPAGFWLYASLMSYKENNFNAIVDFGKEKPLELYAETLMQQKRPKDALTSIQHASDLLPKDVRLLKRKNEIQLLANLNTEPAIKEFYRTCKRGRIYAKVCNMKSQMKKAFSGTTTASLTTDEDISFVPEEDFEAIRNSLKDEKLNEEEFFDYWRKCSQYRFSQIEKCKSVADIFEIWPEYTNSNGNRMYPKAAVTDYELGCRGAFSQNPTQLHCLYNTTTSAFLRLAPIKMEIVHLDPYMVLYHDVLSDQEIEHLKILARPNLKRSTVYNDEKSRSLVVNRRTSKFSWFQDDTSHITLRLNKRITDMTGFNISGSEMLQVMNYGLGGHYDTHYDFFNVTDTTEVVRKEGDRIATVLFYMSDVEQGGATVFPNIDTAVFPRKGSAIMWYNLNNELEGDWRTLHAACPVIVGSKWVCNKWIRSKAQIFRRPCYV